MRLDADIDSLRSAPTPAREGMSQAMAPAQVKQRPRAEAPATPARPTRVALPAARYTVAPSPVPPRRILRARRSRVRGSSGHRRNGSWPRFCAQCVRCPKMPRTRGSDEDTLVLAVLGGGRADVVMRSPQAAASLLHDRHHVRQVPGELLRFALDTVPPPVRRERVRVVHRGRIQLQLGTRPQLPLLTRVRPGGVMSNVCE